MDRTLERSQGALGIGLTLVKRLVEMHGGYVEAKSDGHGSEFSVRLPVVPNLLMAGTTSVSDAVGGGGGPRHRILVAHDNKDSAESLAMMLRIMGHEVQVAHDGVEAVDAAKSQPSLVLLDIGMPKINGYEAARRIRELPGGKKIVMIALTGWGQDGDKRCSQEAGFDHHMVKPVDPAALEKVLARAGGGAT